MTRRRLLSITALAVALAGCSTPAPTEPPPPSPTAAPSPAPTAEPTPAGPALAARPEGDVGLWLDTIGVPVAAAVRTSAPLAQLADTTPSLRLATCRQVATELDAIATPQLLTGLAVTADAETATLLVADLDAKADLLSACEAGGPELDALAVEVAATHQVAVAWLAVLRGGS